LAHAGLSDRLHFKLEDYRATDGSLNRIVSVNMFGQVGGRSYNTYFQACCRLLREESKGRLQRTL
jgi:cyclopropane-fatty-acyl-phospholipid synthase